MTGKVTFQPPILIELTVEHVSELAHRIPTDPGLDPAQRHEKLVGMGLISQTKEIFNMTNLISATPALHRTRLQFNDASTAYVTESKAEIASLTLVASRRLWLALKA